MIEKWKSCRGSDTTPKNLHDQKKRQKIIDMKGKSFLCASCRHMNEFFGSILSLESFENICGVISFFQSKNGCWNCFKTCEFIIWNHDKITFWSLRKEIKCSVFPDRIYIVNQKWAANTTLNFAKRVADIAFKTWIKGLDATFEFCYLFVFLQSCVPSFS